MVYDGEYFDVPMKSLKKSHELPLEHIFQNAQGAVCSRLGVKVEPKNQLLKVFKSWKSLHVYLVINDGFIFVYKQNGWGYALNLKEKQDFGYKKDPKEGSQFHAEITLCFKYGDLKLEFGDGRVYHQWWNLLNAFFNPKVNREDLQYFARLFAPDAFSESLKFVVTAECTDQRVSVFRYPANLNLNETVFNQTRLESPPSTEEEEFDTEPSPPQDHEENADDDEEEDVILAGSSIYLPAPRRLRAEKEFKSNMAKVRSPQAPLFTYSAPTSCSNAHGGPSLLRAIEPPQVKTPSFRRATLASSVKAAQHMPTKTSVSRPRLQAEAPTPRSSDGLKNKKKVNYKE